MFVAKNIYAWFPAVLIMLIFMLGGSPLTAAAGEFKVGIIDTGRILSESVYGQKLQIKLAEEVKGQRQALDEKRQEVEKHRQRLEKSGQDGDGEDVLRELRSGFEKSYREFEWLKSDLDKRLKELDRTLVEDMREKVQVVLSDYVERTDYAVVLERSRVAAAGSRVDVTDDIIRLLNRRFK